MKNLLFILAFCLSTGISTAGGSIGWKDVCASIRKSDPELIKAIEKHFTVAPSGGAVRIGWQVDPERAGERIPPYEFEATRKADSKHCTLKIQESDDFEYTGRYTFTATLASEPPATPDRN